tara:strand:+ start:470 stop:1183 length:714 start_codon:yes stop_codon:yes gene_type:complete
MFSLDVIIITLTLFLLLGVSYKLDIPKVSGPLVIVYLGFLFLFRDDNQSFDNTITPSPLNDNNLVPGVTNFSTKSGNPIKSNVKPKPLVLPKTAPKGRRLVKPKEKPIKNYNQEEKDKSNEPYKTALTLRDIQICKDVINRNPVGTDIYFDNSVDTLFCYTRIQNSKGKQEVSHLWYFEEQLMAAVKYNIKTSNIYRSWTRKTILPNQIGAWRVEVQDSANVVIGSKDFIVSNKPTE